MVKTHTAYAAAFVLALLLAHHISHAQTLSASLGWGTFVQGMSVVRNDFTVQNPPPGTSGALLLFYKEDVAHPIDVHIDFKQQNGLIQGVDMGLLEPGTKVRAICLNAISVPIDTTPVYDINILPEPSWMRDADLHVVSVSGRNVQLLADYAVNTGLDTTVPRWVSGIGGRSYSLRRSSVQMDITYNLDTRASTVGSGALKMGVSLFGQRSALRGIRLPGTSITLDQDFNLRIKAADSVYALLFMMDIPLFYLPLPFFSDIRFDAGVIVDGVLKGQVVVGNDGGQWGFVRDGADATGLTAKLRGIGYVRGSIDVLGGLLGSIQGKLSVHGELGGGVEYVSVPTSEIATTFGGSLSVFGELKVRALIFTVAHVGPKQLYFTGFGKMPGRIIATNDGGLLKASTMLVDSTPPMPPYAPQPAIGAYDGDVAVAWLDSLNGRAGLWLAVKDRAADLFETPTLIASNDHGIGAPSVAVLPGGSAILAWTQNRYTPATVPDGIDLRRLLAAQDVYVALRDNVADTISYPMMMPDDTAGPENGRAESEPKVCALGEQDAMLIWLAQASPGTSSVYYAPLHRAGGALQSIGPAPIPGTTGMNRHPQLAALGGGRALAVWTNDPDGVDSTYDMRLMSAVWDGTAWSAPAEVARAGDRETFGATALAADNGRAVLGWIAAASDTTGAILGTLEGRTWDDAAARWNASDTFAVRDTAAMLQNPTASIGAAGQAVLAWQRVPLNDTMAQGEGARGLMMRNLNDAGGSWRTATGLPFLSDTTAYVWNALATFGAGDDLHTLTEEQPRDGSSKVPAGGVRFGSKERGLVWRSLSVSPNLTVNDRPEPGTPVSNVESTRGDLLAGLHVWPNPTRNDFTVTYSLRAASLVTVELVDALGRVVGRVLDERTLEAGTYQTHVSIERAASGIYWVVVRNGAEVRRERVVVGR